MSNRNFLVSGLAFLLSLLVCANVSARNLVDVAHAPATVPAGIMENSIAGAAYQRAVETYGNQFTQTDKGFFPRLGNYFDPDTEGWGLDIQAIGNTIFAVWFTYLANGDPFWYIIVGDLETKGTEGSITGNIEQFEWDPFGTPGSQATATIVGQMTIEWTNRTRANVSWTLDGVDGSANVRFIQFSDDPTLTDMTGHYFPFFAGGWGFTLLTQGQVTVMTMYWYKNGQPVWAQGVAPTWGMHPLIELLYFNGPGLCPACLPRKGAKGGPSTTSLASLQVDYAPDTPPKVNLIWADLLSKGGPLGSQPFSDIPLNFSPVTTQGITSEFGDNFDENYGWFLNGKGGAAVREYERTRMITAGGDSFPPFMFVFPPTFGPPSFETVLADPGSNWLIEIPFPTSKGGGCVPFQYDDGNLGFPTSISGVTQTGYLQFPASGGELSVFSNAACSTPLTKISAFGGPPVPTKIMMAPTGDGHMIKWFLEIALGKENEKSDDHDEED